MKRYENRILYLSGGIVGRETIATEDVIGMVADLNELGEVGWRPWHLSSNGHRMVVFLVREIEPD